MTGVEQEAIVRLATEFANSKGGLAIAGGMAAQYPNGAEIVAAVNILNYIAGAVGSLVKFGADLAIWLRARYQGTRCGRRFRRRAPALGRRDVRPRAHGL